MKAKLSQQGEKILLLEKEVANQKPFGPAPKPTDSCSKKVGNVASKKNKKPLSKELTLMPKSCGELRNSGHFADGIYLVVNEMEPNKIDAVFCQFKSAIDSKIFFFYKNII